MKILVLIPSYNSGAQLLVRTVTDALSHWPDVWVVIDGSTDNSADAVRSLIATHPSLQVITLPINQGKGAAVRHGAMAAQAAGFTHLLTMDADGQHPADFIPRFAALADACDGAAVFGSPVFGPEAPALRIHGRKISNSWVALETLCWGVNDSLFGMRIYPIAALLTAFSSTRWARRFDFDPEIAVRLAWAGVPIATLPTPVRYLTSDDGGISQFRYLRDNTLLTWMHIRLCCGFLLRLPVLIYRIIMGGNPVKSVNPR